MDYNYMEAIEQDIRDYINENIDLADYNGDMNRLNEDLTEILFNNDSITGNDSGSYTFNAYKAEEYLAHNWDLLKDALNEFGYNMTDCNPIEKGAEWCDVLIRCHLLYEAISNVIDELEEEA